MTVLTILLYIISITLIVFLFIQPTLVKPVKIGIIVSSLLIYVLHIIIDDIIWQNYTLYVGFYIIGASFYCTVLQRRQIKRGWFRLIKITSITLVVVSMISSYVFPVYSIPEPTGEYEVGTTSYLITDLTRLEQYGDGNGGYREFEIQLWYPAETTEGYEQVPWLEDGQPIARGLAMDIGLPVFVLDHTTTIDSNSYKDAPINTDQDQYPVVIISHGWRGFKNLHTDFAEDLASQGFIVVSIDHTYGSVASVLTNDKVEYVNYDALPDREDTTDFLDYANQLVYTYGGDITATLNSLETENERDTSILYHKMDVSSIGLLGHSTGGGAGVSVALVDDRIDAIFGLDSWVEPIGTTALENGLDIPSLFVRSGQWETGYNNQYLYTLIENTPNSILYQIDGTTHYDLTMVYMYSPLTRLIGFTGDVEGRYLNNIQRSMISEFFLRTLVTNNYNNTIDDTWDEVREIPVE